jgi:hypothetical protein
MVVVGVVETNRVLLAAAMLVQDALCHAQSFWGMLIMRVVVLDGLREEAASRC